MNSTNETKRRLSPPASHNADGVTEAQKELHLEVKDGVSQAKRSKSTGKAWKRPEFPDELINPLPSMNEAANEELVRALSAPVQNTNPKVQIGMEFDLRNNSKFQFWARIKDAEGVPLAEVWGTKSGKSRSYVVWPGGDLDADSKKHLSLALPVARKYVTGNTETSMADDSASEIGSDLSDDET